jgi:sec-independent protein translocase protein TatA
MNFGAPELLILLLIVLVLFGSSQLPKFARSLGESAKELRGLTKDESPKA